MYKVFRLITKNAVGHKIHFIFNVHAILPRIPTSFFIGMNVKF